MGGEGGSFGQNAAAAAAVQENIAELQFGAEFEERIYVCDYRGGEGY